MDEEMHDVAPPPSSTSRKRTADDVDDNDNDRFETTTTETPSKRFRNPQGEAIERKLLRFNAHELFSDVAFTRLYVTANYDRYSITQSPILLTVLSRHDALYRAVCQTLPALYDIAPNLQALAVIPDVESSLDHPELIDPACLRILPMVNFLSLSDTTSDRLNALLDALPHSRNIVLLLDPAGHCLWSSDVPDFNSVDKTSQLLGTALKRNLQAMAPSDAMDQGV
ncbi:hypothetical protein PRZ48_008102 [Zasmidium cellare]|uniref:Uncharacterized protein n=1 Tax=Zasmidium cellare TaxID=395010 RepID=A0ABR0EF74_ZASCE|nr:hypothetical protein PRZ48_008102 [Zasmidium cellare]